MGLFTPEQSLDPPGGAAARMSWTRELGTRKLILLCAALVAIWFAYTRVSDTLLMKKHWEPLTAQPSGLSIVGALDPRTDYDRNLFKILQMNHAVRVDLTEFGWRSIFNEQNGPMFGERYGSAILSARQLNDLDAAAMLEPYVRAGVGLVTGRPELATLVQPNMPISVMGDGEKRVARQTTLGTLMNQYLEKPHDSASSEPHEDTEGGSNSGHTVDRGTALTPELLVGALPVILVGGDFSSAELEEHAPDILGDITYTLHLNLTPEGRSRFFQWSHLHSNESLVFVLNHQVLAAGRINGAMDVNNWDIGPLRDKAAVQQIVDYVNKSGHD